MKLTYLNIGYQDGVANVGFSYEMPEADVAAFVNAVLAKGSPVEPTKASPTSEPAPPAGSPAPATQTAELAATPEAAPEASPRRSRRSVDPSPAVVAEAPAEGNGRRRRRGNTTDAVNAGASSTAPQGASATSPSDAHTMPAGATLAAVDDLTDGDMARLLSDAAQVLGAERVRKDLMETFNVANFGVLTQPQRRAFKAMMDVAKAGK